MFKLTAYTVSIPNASYVRCHTPALNDDAVYLKPKYVAKHVVHMDGYNAWPQGPACYEDKALASSWTSGHAYVCSWKFENTCIHTHVYRWKVLHGAQPRALHHYTDRF